MTGDYDFLNFKEIAIIVAIALLFGLFAGSGGNKTPREEFLDEMTYDQELYW